MTTQKHHRYYMLLQHHLTIRVVCFILCFGTLYSQNSTEPNSLPRSAASIPSNSSSVFSTEPLYLFSNEIGLNLSSFLASGVTYRRTIAPSYHVRVSGIYYYSTQDTNSVNEYVTIGSDIQYDVFQHTHYRVYLTAGGSYTYDYTKVPTYDFGIQPPPPTTSDISTRREYSGVVGFGIQACIWGRLVFNVDASAAYVRRLSRFNSTTAPVNIQITYGGGAGIGFLF